MYDKGAFGANLLQQLEHAITDPLKKEATAVASTAASGASKAAIEAFDKSDLGKEVHTKLAKYEQIAMYSAAGVVGFGLLTLGIVSFNTWQLEKLRRR